MCVKHEYVPMNILGRKFVKDVLIFQVIFSEQIGS